jgi:leader peptidase (prepilin peptidase)/N-methyltransferase
MFGEMGLIPLFVFVIGLLFGSFINVCIYRLPLKQSIVAPRSHCPSCKTPITPYDNIPVVSFLWLRGRCRACQAAISWRYPLVELLHAIGYLLILYRFGPTLPALLYALFFSALMAITFIDLDHQIIPDVITLPGIVLGLLAGSTVLPPGPMNALIGLLIGGGFFYLIAILSLTLLKKEGMGGGDIKLVAMIGAILGWEEMLLAIFCAAITGSVIGITLVATKQKDRTDPIPFGPFLAAGALVSLFWGNEIIEWYFNRL